MEPTTPEQWRNAAYREDSIALDEGQAILRWPARMDGHSVAIFRDWLQLVLRRVDRAADRPPPPPAPPPPPTDAVAVPAVVPARRKDP